jgi:hypothetical protein
MCNADEIELDLKITPNSNFVKKRLKLKVFLQIQRTYLKIRLKVPSKTKKISNPRLKL